MRNWLVEKLEELFATPGLTVQRVADATGIPRSYISLMKTGRQVPSEEVVRRLARFFGEDEEEWAFKTKGEPKMDELRRRFPNYTFRYARKMTEEGPGDTR